MPLVDRLWYGDDLLARTARLALHPASLLYRAVVTRRNARFDAADRMRMGRPMLPSISVGNLTVGGTGKTPVAAWCVRQLRARGANPAVVMRGYGDDEWRVHTMLNPGTQVIVAPDRVAGVLTARTRGADCAVLDDAFQHRRAARVADIVLLSVDAWCGEAKLLPAGPFREGLASLRRASVVVLTQKVHDAERSDTLAMAVRRVAPDVPIATVRLALGDLRLAATAVDVSGRASASRDRTGMLVHPPQWLADRRIAVVSAVGNPSAFEAQLAAWGADLLVCRRYRDHHQFTAADAVRVARDAGDADAVVCTLKDAVKLGALWPRQAPPLWYVSQTVVVERGAEALEHVLDRVVAARVTAIHTAG